MVIASFAIMPALVVLPMLGGATDATFDWRALALPRVRQFRAHDEETLHAQVAAQQLESLFESDAR